MIGFTMVHEWLNDTIRNIIIINCKSSLICIRHRNVDFSCFQETPRVALFSLNFPWKKGVLRHVCPLHASRCGTKVIFDVVMAARALSLYWS